MKNKIRLPLFHEQNELEMEKFHIGFLPFLEEISYGCREPSVRANCVSHEFDSEQYTRDSHKAELGKHVKDKVVTLTSCTLTTYDL